jgi:hypothetical protein
MQKTATLKAMGIQTWYPRVDLPLAKREVPPQVEQKESVLCYCYQWQKAGKVVACLLAEYGKGSSDESNLIAAIAKALPFEHQGGCKELSVAGLKQLGVPMIVLGETLLQELGLRPSATVLKAGAPTAMLADQSLKREAWKQLQALVS